MSFLIRNKFVLCVFYVFLMLISQRSEAFSEPDFGTPLKIKAERIYFDVEEMPMGEDAFHIHLGDNEWIKTSHIHRDVSGFFTYILDVERETQSMEYVRHWKCPYCFKYWPMGTACQNPACPSKYQS